MIAPMWCFRIGSPSLKSFSTIGIKKANVLPLPVTAYCDHKLPLLNRFDGMLTSTTTSLLPMNSGIVLACTGVMRSKPILEVASRIHSESAGVRASQARDEDVAWDALALLCAIIRPPGSGRYELCS